MQQPHPSAQCAACLPQPTMQMLTGNIIRRFREIRGMSQGTLARAAAANLSYISSIESGRNNISIKKALTLCNALDLPPSSLVSILVQFDRSLRLDRHIVRSADQDVRLAGAQLFSQ